MHELFASFLDGTQFLEQTDTHGWKLLCRIDDAVSDSESPKLQWKPLECVVRYSLVLRMEVSLEYYTLLEQTFTERSRKFQHTGPIMATIASFILAWVLGMAYFTGKCRPLCPQMQVSRCYPRSNRREVSYEPLEDVPSGIGCFLSGVDGARGKRHRDIREAYSQRLGQEQEVGNLRPRVWVDDGRQIRVHRARADLYS